MQIYRFLRTYLQNNYNEFLSVGINDWGGISPITTDYINPEFSWPNIQNVEKEM